MKCTPSDQYPNEYEALHQASEEVKAAIREVNSFQPDSVAVERAKRTMELQAKLEFPCFTVRIFLAEGTELIANRRHRSNEMYTGYTGP